MRLTLDELIMLKMSLTIAAEDGSIYGATESYEDTTEMDAITARLERLHDKLDKAIRLKKAG